MVRGNSMLAALTVAVAVVLGQLIPNETALAQGIEILLRLTNFSTNTTPDGIRITTATNVPLTTLTGQVVGTGSVTSVEAHPALEYLPTWIELRSGAIRIFGGVLASRDGSFRQGAAYEMGASVIEPSVFHDVGLLLPSSIGGSPAGGTGALKLKSFAQTPTTPTTLTHAFQFTANRVDRQVGSTGLTYRPGNQWELVIGAGGAIRVGDNPGAGYANLLDPTIVGSLSFLRLPDNVSGAVVTCVGSPPVCGLQGVGIYAGLYGTAFSRNPASLGLNANAASDTVVNRSADRVRIGSPFIPVNPNTPAPQNLLGVRADGITTLVWDSVAGAEQYFLEIFYSDGSFGNFLRDGTTVSDGPGGNMPSLSNAVAFSVVALGPGGRGLAPDRQPIVAFSLLMPEGGLQSL